MRIHTALTLCRLIERVAPEYGAHIALTGGCLYKDGERKDIDIIVYRIRQTPRIDYEGLFQRLKLEYGIEKVSGFGWCHKAVWREALSGLEFNIDFLFPEETEYEGNEKQPIYNGEDDSGEVEW